MADNGAKREPVRDFDEFAGAKPNNYKKIPKDRNIYTVEITQVGKARGMVIIHFKGYSEKFGERRPWGENN